MASETSDPRPITVVALGGNALLRRGETASVAVQRDRARAAAAQLTPLLAERRLLVTHGNGPQIGRLAELTAAGPDPAEELDVLGAESEGLIGYLLEQAIQASAPGVDVATLLTETIVDAGDPAFSHPTKPIGPVYDEATARRLARERGWQIRPDGAGWRRVVASPEPLGFVEARTIELLLRHGVVTICAGGGGVPVVVDGAGWRGVAAVVDKDLAAALLAELAGAEQLVLLTDVDAVTDGWGTSAARPLRRVSVTEARRRVWDAGSMAPKVEAACRFAANGRPAAIGSLDRAADVVHGRSGTLVVPDDAATTWW